MSGEHDFLLASQMINKFVLKCSVLTFFNIHRPPSGCSFIGHVRMRCLVAVCHIRPLQMESDTWAVHKLTQTHSLEGIITHITIDYRNSMPMCVWCGAGCTSHAVTPSHLVYAVNLMCVSYRLITQHKINRYRIPTHTILTRRLVPTAKMTGNLDNKCAHATADV